MKPHQEEHKHKRYYVFQHTGGENIMYRTGEGGWTDDFRVAELWANEDFAFKKAGTLKKQHMSWAKGLPADAKSALPTLSLEVSRLKLMVFTQ